MAASDIDKEEANGTVETDGTNKNEEPCGYPGATLASTSERTSTNAARTEAHFIGEPKTQTGAWETTRPT